MSTPRDLQRNTRKGYAAAAVSLIALLNASPTVAQSPKTLDTASVKQLAPDDNQFRGPSLAPNGRFTAKAGLRMLIAVAYKLPFNQSVRLAGVPDWATTREGAYEIDATATLPPNLSAQARTEAMRRMLQALLADRFKLAIHRETKNMPVYALVVRKGGPKLQPAGIQEKDCPDPDAAPAPNTQREQGCHEFMGGRGRGLHARAITMEDLVGAVENWTDRPLLDKTGIKGLYRIETEGWLEMQAGPEPPAGTKSETGANIGDVPTIYTMFERLGLEMKPQKDNVDIYVVDHLERPSAN